MIGKKTAPSPPHPRKQRIIEAAVTCFLDAGYHQTGVRDIAHRAGISLGNLYNHFSGKEAVLAEIARIEAQELEAFHTLLAAGPDPKATLKRFVEDYAKYAARPENAVLGLEILSEAIRAPQIATLFSGNRAGLVSGLEELLEKGTRTGHFRAFEDPRETAGLIHDAIEGRALRVLLKDAKGSAKTTLWRFIDAATQVKP
ncbi:MAG: TetR/AcrR family transcriptional regulator [Nitratireductor sp.]